MSESCQELRKSSAGSLAQAMTEGVLSVGDLERALLESFPVKDACSWDKTGLFVGNPHDEVQGVAIALDPTIRALKEAYAQGANVLVTHHPVFLDNPGCFTPEDSQGHTSGSVIHFALSHGMSVMSFHTACDVSLEGLSALPQLLMLDMIAPLEPLAHNELKGFGMICQPTGPLTLRTLAARCVSVFGSFPRVWGNPDTILSRVATSGGSGTDLIPLCYDHGVDCLVTGELKYHACIDAAESGLCMIELGHDVSELPLCSLLAAKVASAGVSESAITIINQQDNWYTPETIRR